VSHDVCLRTCVCLSKREGGRHTCSRWCAVLVSRCHIYTHTAHIPVRDINAQFNTEKRPGVLGWLFMFYVLKNSSICQGHFARQVFWLFVRSPFDDARIP